MRDKIAAGVLAALIIIFSCTLVQTLFTLTVLEDGVKVRANLISAFCTDDQWSKDAHVDSNLQESCVTLMNECMEDGEAMGTCQVSVGALIKAVGDSYDSKD